MKDVYLSVFESDIFYRFQEFNFYFSSKARKERFEKGFLQYADEELMKLTNKYNLNFELETFELMFAFNYYSKCEKRGFKVQKVSSSGVVLLEFKEPPYFKISYFIE